LVVVENTPAAAGGGFGSARFDVAFGASLSGRASVFPAGALCGSDEVGVVAAVRVAAPPLVPLRLMG
jgi:hypothetical protein